MNYAIVFPGQGAQSVGMLAELAAVYPQVQQTFEEASDALGYDLWALTQNGPESELNKTQITQPAMLTAGMAVWRVLDSQIDMAPAALAGHSLGEYTALTAAEVWPLADAVQLVALRGELMQNAVPEGAGKMAAILGLSDEDVIALCEEAAQGQVCEAVNFNSPGQVVIAGDAPAVERAMALAEAKGAKRVVPLAVSAPSHCSLMKPAAEKLAEKLADMPLNTPRFPVLHNVDVQSHADVDALRNALVQQLYKPVQWVKTIEALKVQGVEQLFEFGPGKVLTGLNRRIDRRFPIAAVMDPASVEAAIEAMES
ncbi:[Acyl-carrier-protein] S-malonyltransferase [Sulfurivirga caldicuralii]|uniref:Malonyl CoA-acyl carrier protein transacylase n=1 Tax=Sulfurivirga caldicuralii TaxID=364032 RepID=A0A1N6EMQ6_9GAMM|nr:ACP S-malonyltransferase [Sulfurivirga caldicuralii]SIN84295.1 [Acyl-carrier-protein] S-malonyltransferase [Sulfurivirga caldicuralii]